MKKQNKKTKATPTKQKISGGNQNVVMGCKSGCLGTHDYKTSRDVAPVG